ncbi:XRE family transcriptional regulator [Pseudomonas sp. PB101]|uniref:helix-turn-helix domain-containing protein n=1 Tax=Pseudomonas sp. PB101 TaxID=2495428 RepID=UPI001365B88A|nr:XRE family transcriptional regulator [Pseudomonas sp. PB101]
MELKIAFGTVLRWLRLKQGQTQEDFSTLSSRTYISTLERGIYAPTIDKLDDIATVLGTHPITLMVGSYALKDNRSVAKVLEDVMGEIERLEVAEGVSKLRKRYVQTE